jgi:hypothetical protein
MKKIFVIGLGLFFSLPVLAQVTRARLQASGLTCAICARSVYKNLDGQEVKNDQHLKIGGTFYHFLSIKDQVLQGEKEFSLVEKNYLPANDFKKYAGATTMQCFKTGLAASCCSWDGVPARARIYHVTL